MHIEPPQGHDQLGRDRRKQILQKHRRKDRGVPEPLVGLHGLADQLGQLGDGIDPMERAKRRKSSMGRFVDPLNDQ